MVDLLRHLFESYFGLQYFDLQRMGEYCLASEPVHETEIIFGFFVFALFFFVLFYCHKTSSRMKNIERKSQLAKINMTLKKRPKYNFHEEESVNSIAINQHQDEYEDKGYIPVRQGPKVFANLRNPQQTIKKLSGYAYHYHENQHEMTKIYRSAEEILEQRQLYLNRTTKKPLSSNIKNQQTNVDIKKIDNPTNIVSPAQKNKLNQTKITQPAGPMGPSSTKPGQKAGNILGKVSLIGPSQDKKDKLASQPLFPNINNTQNKNSLPTSNPGFIQTNPLFPIKQSVESMSSEKNQPSKPSMLFPMSNQKSDGKQQSHPQKQSQIQSSFKPQTQPQPQLQPHQQTQPPLNIQINKAPENKTQNIPQKPISTPNQQSTQQAQELINVPTALKGGDAKITSSAQYLDAIIKYSNTFSVKTHINTIISNLSGAKSDPIEFWLFATDVIKTVNTSDVDQVKTFSYKMWETIFHKFIKNTNIKDGFEKMPPKQKSKQVQKNSINTYILLINMFRTMGHQTIWLGVFGLTLKTLQFIYKRKQPIKVWTKLELIQSKYLTLDGDVSSKYHSRIDFLLYFLLGLTTFDPILVFQEVSEKTKQNYPFIGELKKYKHKWSYRQFWCLIDVVKKNPLVSYFKIPFWGNALATIYLQMLQNLKNPQNMKQFTVLSKWIFKQIKLQTSLICGSEQGSALQQQYEDNRAKQYEFDGQQFVNGIKTLGKGFETKQRQMRITRWQQFRDKWSIFYYFWRINT